MSARSKPGPKARSASASQFHSTVVEKRPRRLSSLISQALSFDDPTTSGAYAAGEVGFLARALVQATMPHSDPKTNEFVRHNGRYTLDPRAEGRRSPVRSLPAPRPRLPEHRGSQEEDAAHRARSPLLPLLRRARDSTDDRTSRFAASAS